VPERDKEELNISIQTINVVRAKITALAFIIIEIVLLTISVAMRNDEFLQKPYIYYNGMYLLMVIIMTIHLIVYTRLAKNVKENCSCILYSGVIFTSFILIWSAGISLIDQMSGGQIILYLIAVIAVAVTPLYHPIILFSIYFVVHLMFIILLPHLAQPDNHLFGNYINSTSTVLISLAISYMRYRNQVKNFYITKKIQEQNDELKRVNRELEEANKKLEKLTQTDALTGIFNRFMFDQIIIKDWKRCKDNKTCISLIMVDIDFFKAFNDNYGHQAGDSCIRRVAEVLSECSGHYSDYVVRYGGEEFAVILPSLEKETATELAEEMRIRVENMKIRHEYSSVSNYVTISLGVYTVVPSENNSIDEFIRIADTALYAAKNEERNKVVMA
jgi:diguanylate cyclase (GGDEF)-like protein